jgi:hypothetical protein
MNLQDSFIPVHTTLEEKKYYWYESSNSELSCLFIALSTMCTTTRMDTYYLLAYILEIQKDAFRDGSDRLQTSRFDP